MTINLLKGMGKAYQAYKRNRASKSAIKKMKSGSSTREDRIKHGIRDADIKSVKRTTKSLKKSKEAGHGHMYMKNIKEINKHKGAIAKGKEAKKKIQHMKDTKRAYSIGDYDAPADPSNPPKKGWDK